MYKMSKTKNGGISLSLIAVLVLVVLALGLTLFRKNNDDVNQILQKGESLKQSIFVKNVTVTPVPDSVIDKKLMDLNSGSTAVDASFKDAPITDF